MLIYNTKTRHVYSIDNRKILLAAMRDKGWQNGEFAGFQQWKEAGRTVRKGEKGTQVVVLFDKTVTKDGNPETVKLRKAAYVFNIDQTEATPLPPFTTASLSATREQ